MRKSPPLFPTPWTNDSDMLNSSPEGYTVAPGETVVLNGATLRDYFAAKAMASLINATSWAAGAPDDCAKQAYQHADAMLNARSL